MSHSEQNSTKTSPISLPTLIGQDLHILNAEFIQAVEQRDQAALVRLATRQVEAGAMALDLNLGPIAKSRDVADWTITTILDACKVPLFVSSQILTHPDLLDKYRGQITINSVTAEKTSMHAAMQTAKDYGAQLVVLLVRPGLTPFTADERLQLAAEVLEAAGKINFPIQNLYLDPLFHLRPDPITWQLSRGIPDVDSVLETITLLPQLAGTKIRTLIALSSASQFIPDKQRSALHCRLLLMLTGAGLDAVILNCRDKHLMEVAGSPKKDTPEPVQLPRSSGNTFSQATVHW